MAGTGLANSLELVDPAVRPVISAYLDDLASRLPCGRSAKAAIIAEVGDGLIDAVAAKSDAGIEPTDAARAAIIDFGGARVLAREFATELAGAVSNRVGLVLLATGPAVGSVWVAAFAARSGIGWWQQLPAMWAAMPVYALILAVAVPAALLSAVAGSRRLHGRVHLDGRRAAGAALIATSGCVVGDAVLLIAWSVSAQSEWTVLAWTACAISLVRLSCAVVAGRRCAMLRAAAG
ncbi:MAG: hypothetical protein H0T54_04205 [Geodermatophilaceae bacterium]|nr:hypothetical protein [Geodermatophilaceae bacterium]